MKRQKKKKKYPPNQPNPQEKSAKERILEDTTQEQAEKEIPTGATENGQ